MENEVPMMMLEPAVEKRTWRQMSKSYVSKGHVSGPKGEEKRQVSGGMEKRFCRMVNRKPGRENEGERRLMVFAPYVGERVVFQTLLGEGCNVPGVYEGSSQGGESGRVCLWCSRFSADTAGPLEGSLREEGGRAEQCSCEKPLYPLSFGLLTPSSLSLSNLAFTRNFF